MVEEEGEDDLQRRERERQRQRGGKGGASMEERVLGPRHCLFVVDVVV